MEFEENKDNIIEEGKLPEEVQEIAEPVAEETAAKETAKAEQAAEEMAAQEDAAQTSAEAEAALEEAEAGEGSAEEASSQEPAAEGSVPEETAEKQPEAATEELAPETTEEEASAEAAAPAEEPAPEETEAVSEGNAPETEGKPEEAAEEEPASDEPPLITEIVPEEAPAEEPEKEAESEVPEIEFERVIPEVIVMEVTEEALADAVEPKKEPEPETIRAEEMAPSDESEPEDEEPETAELPQEEEPVMEELQPEEVTAEEPHPEAAEPETKEEQTENEEIKEEAEEKEKPEKKGSGALAVKIVGIILLLLLIFVPAGYSLLKGETFRKELIDQKKSMSRVYESVYRKEIFPKLSQLFIPEWAKKAEPEPEPQGSGQVEPEPQTPDKPKDILDGVPQVPDGLEYYPLYIEDHMIIYGRDDWLYTAGDGGAALEYFAGTNVLSEEDMAYCADLLNTLDEVCKAKGVELVMEVGPNKEQVYPEHFPSYTVETPYKRLLVLEEYLQEHCTAPFLYPVRELAAHKDQYDTYWKYDTHWNTTGSYIGMKAIYEALGRPVKESDAVMNTQETNRGDLAGITGYTDLYTDYITDYKPDVTVETEVYCDWEYDIDDYGKRYTSPNERKLVVVGDSFRVSLAAHMCKDYKYTDVIHRDIITLEIPVARLQELSEGDTLVLICVERWDDRMFAVIPDIIAAMQE